MTKIEPENADWSSAVPTGFRTPTAVGLFVLVAVFAGFGLWAVTAPLQGAVVASGKFVATGKNKVIQHLEGGIVERIKVSEGDRVSKGDVLVTLDETGPKANMRLLSHRHHRLQAVQARLIAESNWDQKIQFDAALTRAAFQDNDADIQLIVSRQRKEFAARRMKLETETSILEQEIAAHEEAITGFKAEIVSIGTQLGLIEKELEDKTKLHEQQWVTLHELLKLKRTKAQLVGRLARLTSTVAEEKKGIAKSRSQILHIRAKATDQAIAELRKIEGELDDLREQRRKARDVLKRVDITAPANGVVIKLMHHAPGAVIKPGGEVLQLVPVGDEPIIEALVAPRDIDNVENGQDARVRLTALNQRLTPTVTGQVVYVSADTVESRQGSSYVIHIKLDAEMALALGDSRLIPGMPVEAFINTGERTFFDYLMRPVVDSMARAFRES